MGVCIIMIVQAILTRQKLLLAKSTCQEQPLHILIDGQVDDTNAAMECVCLALDNAKCPNHLQVHILIPLNAPDEVTAWDLELIALCSSKPNYNTFFKENIHFYKYNFRKRITILHQIATLLKDLEGVHDSSHVMFLPSLTKLVQGWDTLIRNDILTMSEILVYPLIKAQETYFIEPPVKTGFFTINPGTLGFEVKEFVTPKQSFSLGLSLRHPIIAKKSIWCSLKNAPCEDLAITAFCLDLDYGIVHGANAIGSSLYKNGSNKSRAFTELESLATPKSLKHFSMAFDGSFTVFAKSILGIHEKDTLEEKIFKYGSEAKYQSAKQTILF